MNYYRITAYEKERNFSFIIDSHGVFEKLWQFSSYLLSKGFEIIEVSKEENMLDVNFDKVAPNTESLILRATCAGKPEHITQTIKGQCYQAIKVNDKIYIPKIR